MHHNIFHFVLYFHFHQTTITYQFFGLYIWSKNHYKYIKKLTFHISYIQEDIKAQRDKLQREREALQTQMDLFEQLKAQTALSHQQESYSPNSSSDSPSLSRNTSWTHDSPTIRPVPPSSVPQTLWDNVAHKRSSSEDLQRSNHGEPYEPMKQEYSHSLKEPLHSNRDSRETNREAHRDSRSRSDSRTRLHPSPSQSAGNSPSSGSGPTSGKQRDAMLPIHLISATNEQKMGPVAQQQLPLKLVAQLGSSKSSSNLQASNSSGKLPHKSPGGGELSPSASQSASPYASAGSGAAPAGAAMPHNVGSHHHHQPLQQTPVTYSTGPGGNSVPLPPTKHVMMPPNMNIVNPGGHSTHHADQHGSGGSTSGRVHGSSISGSRHQPSQTMSMLPMKLASQKGRQKSGSSSSSNLAQRHPQQQLQQQGAVGNPAHQETPRSSKHSQKSSRKEQEIIYFWGTNKRWFLSCTIPL